MDRSASYDWPRVKYEEWSAACDTRQAHTRVLLGHPGREDRGSFEQIALLRRTGVLPPQPLALGEVSPSSRSWRSSASPLTQLRSDRSDIQRAQ